MKTNKSATVKWSLIIGIILIINLFVNYGLSFILDEPDFEELCPTERVVNTIDSEEQCLEEGGAWTAFTEPAPTKPGGEIATGYCDRQFECRQNYDDLREAYEKNVFISLISIGVVILIIGLLIRTNSVISVSLAFAAVLDFIIASIRYWSSAHNVIKVSVLGIALAVLIFLAYKFFGDNSSESGNGNNVGESTSKSGDENNIGESTGK